MVWLTLCLHSFQLAGAVTPKDRDALVEELRSTGCLEFNKPTGCTANLSQWDVSKVT